MELEPPTVTEPVLSWIPRWFRSHVLVRLLTLRREGGEGLRHALVLVSGTAAGQAIALAATPFLTRLYTPGQFGLLAIVVSFLNVAAVMVTLRYELSVLSAPDAYSADRLMAVTLGVSIPGSVVAGVALRALVRWDVLSYGVLPWWTPLAVIPALIATAAFTACRAWAIRAHRVGEVSGLLITQGLGRAIVPLAWAATMSTGLAGLLVGEIAGRVIGCGRLLRIAWPRLRPWLHARRIGYLWNEAKINWQMPIIAVPSGLLDALGMSLPAILLAYRFSAREAGLFLLVQRLIFLPTSLVGASAADVFHVRIARTLRDDPARVRGAVLALVGRLFGLGALSMIPVAFLAPSVLPVLLGGAWSEAGTLIVALIPWSIATLSVSPVSRLLVVVGRNQRKLIYDILAISVVLGTVLGSASIHLDFHRTILALSVGQAAAYAVYLALVLSAAPRPQVSFAAAAP